MKFSRRRAVSPIIASLLLIAIAVAAGIIVYVYVNSLAGGLTSGGGSQVSQQLQMQAYSFKGLNGNGTSSSNGVIADINLENTGGSSLTISAVYYNGVALTQWYTTGGVYYAHFLNPTSGGNCYAVLTSSPVVASVTHTTSLATSGTAAGGCGATASTTCSAAVCFETGNAASAETPNTTIASQGTAQLVIGVQGGATSGTSYSIKVVTATGGTSVFTITAGRTG